MRSFDYVIVGGGSAGCTLANRLSAGSRTVLLIEAGMDHGTDVPADIRDTYAASYYNPAYKWPGFKVHWGNAGNSPATTFDQARVIGGGSSVMGMIALRGTSDDYDEWAALGAAGWSWDQVLPYFRRLETDRDFPNDLHGSDGPVPIRRIPQAQWTPLARSMVAVSERMQLPYIADMNGDFREGYGAVPISSWENSRGSAAIAYLTADIRARPNLTIMGNAEVQSILFEARAATAVRLGTAKGELTIGAGEVILAAGALHTPLMLIKSGIGPVDQLDIQQRPPVAVIPGVGNNLQNHPLLFVAAYLRPPGRQAASLRPHGISALRYSSGVAGGQRSDMYMTMHSKSSWSALGRRLANISPTLLKPRSRGRVRLAPGGGPLVEFEFLSDPCDQARMEDGFRKAAEIVASPDVKALYSHSFPIRFTDKLRQLNRLTRGNAVKAELIAATLDTLPFLRDPIFARLTAGGAGVAALAADAQALSAHVRENIAGTFHVAGTCRMGPAEDPGAVVDRAGRVHGIGRLRVADASVMPTLPRGNTNIPTIMIAEKLSDAILAG